MSIKVLLILFVTILVVTNATYNGKPPVPSAAITVVGAACRTSLVLTWGPSLGDQNTAAILYYELQVDQGSSTVQNTPTGVWKLVYSGSALTTEVVGLVANTNYLFRARGVNADGAGDYRYADATGAVVQFTTSANRLPDKPVAPTVTLAGATALTLSFTSLTTCKYDITGYDLLYRLNSDGLVSTANPGTAIGARDLTLTRQVTGLTASLAYNFAVIAYIGITPSADPAASTATNLAFTTLGQLAISNLDVTFGPLEGSTLITITGTSFTAGIKCKFGINDLVPATVVSVTSLKCLTPRGIGVSSTQVYLVPNNIYDSSSSAAPQTFSFLASMFVSDFKANAVQRFFADTGAFIDSFIPSGSGGLDGPWGHAFSPEDRNFYVASEGTSSILQYNGNTGAFIKTFCLVSGQPRGFVFHLRTTVPADTFHDLYVASAYNDKVYRYNGVTGAPRGIYGDSPALDAPWQVSFSRRPATDVDIMYVSSEYTDNILRFDLPDPASVGPDIFKGLYRDVLTKKKVNYVNGFDFTDDSLYATGPYSGKAIVRFDRHTGAFIDVFIDENLLYPVDLKIYFKGVQPSETDPEYIYVCSEDQVRKYDRITGEFLGIQSQKTGLVSSYLTFHKNWLPNVGN